MSLSHVSHVSHAMLRCTHGLTRRHIALPLQFLPTRTALFQQYRFAGHNKWSKVKHTKGAKDAKKSKMYSKISLEIVSAMRTGGPDPIGNARLATILSRAKAASMPKDNIEAAMNKGAGRNKDVVEDVIYECYGPGGIAMIIEAVTDKRSRTVKEIKEVLNRRGGSVSTVDWLFDKKGKVVFATGDSGASEDAMMEAAIEAGAEDMDAEQDGLVEVICDFTQLNEVRTHLVDHKYDVQQMEATYIPQSYVEVNDPDTAELVERCLEEIENLDDVVKIHTNAVVKS